MSRPHSIMFTIAAFVILCYGGRATAHADPLVLTLTNALQSGAPGQTVNFSGGAFNRNPSASDVDQIVVFGVNISGGPAPPAIDFSSFVDNFGGRSVAGGQTLGPLPLFAVSIPDGTPAGTVLTGEVYFNYFNNNAHTPLLSNSESFTITVASPTATPVPEPATLLLLGAGLTGLGARLRKRRLTSTFRAFALIKHSRGGR